MPEDKSQKSQTTASVKSAGKRKVTKRTSISKQYCGVIMPISGIDGCNEQHWDDVREIVEAAVEKAGFEPRLVSDADEVGIIQKRIIQNVYNDPVVVCDVSGKNPNVMFELGMRLAFDKPTIIVKDDKTTYTFDTAPIEHLEYPRDLRFAKIVEFQDNLTAKIEATHKKAQTDKNYTTFLKNFGSFSVAKLETRTLDRDDFILEELRSLKSLVMRQPRIIDESSSGRRIDDIEPSIAQQEFMHYEVQKAIRQIGPRKSRKDLHNLVFQEIVKSKQKQDISKYFRTRMEFDRALDRELRSIGVVK
jgi:hypothetical protein